MAIRIFFSSFYIHFIPDPADILRRGRIRFHNGLTLYLRPGDGCVVADPAGDPGARPACAFFYAL